MWNKSDAEKCVYNFNEVNLEIQEKIVGKLSKWGSYSDYENQVTFLESAINNRDTGKKVLNGVTQKYPETIDYRDINPSNSDLSKYAIVITAGGEGERLKVSLIEDEGYSEADLKDFTKATIAIPDFHKDFGALQTNLALISKISKNISVDIPVIVTTGPKGTTTERVINELLKSNDNYGLKNLKVIAQNEKLHLTSDKKIAFIENDGNVELAVNPDETGGPIMKLKDGSISWIKECGATKIMVLQGTAIYNPKILSIIATAGISYDGMGIGIARETFPNDDPYGTFVQLENSNSSELKIIEKDIRNSNTETLKSGNSYLPFNTGFYVFDISILENNSLPAYCTPDKIITKDMPKSPKTGFAATDIIGFSSKSAVLTISEKDYAVIKSSKDLQFLSEKAKEFNLNKFI